MQRVTRSALPAALLVASLAACSSTPERAETVGGTEKSSSAASGSGSEQDASGATKALTAEQAEAALLTVEDMPTGWSEAPGSEGDEAGDDAPVEPAECDALLDEVDDLTDSGSGVDTSRSFSQGGNGAVTFEQRIHYADGGQEEVFEKFTEAIGECSDITMDFGSGPVPVTLSPLSFPDLGEQTLAFRLQAEVSGQTVVVDTVQVSDGHQVVDFAASGLNPLPGAEMEELARAGMKKVAEAAS